MARLLLAAVLARTSLRSSLGVVFGSCLVLPAVHVKGLTGDAARQIACHEQDGRGHLVLGGQPLQIAVDCRRLVDLLDGATVLARLVLEVTLQRATPDV